MADLTKSVQGRRRPRNPGPVDSVLQFLSFDEFTKSVLHFDGADGSTSIVDSIGHIWSVNGNAQIDTDQSRFGGASGKFDGTTDYLLGDGSPDFSFGTGAFTIDFWFKLAATGTTCVLYDTRNDTSATPRNTIFYDGTNVLVYIMGVGVVITSATVPIANRWYHLALSRSAGSTKLFIDGVNEGATYSDSHDYVCPASRPVVGADGAGGAFGSSWNGWIDELRISKGIARWTANFVPPGYAYGGFSLLDDPFTKSLLHFNGPDAGIDFFDESGHIWKPVGNAQLDTAQFKFGTAALLSDGTGDAITGDSSSDFIFGTGDFTIDYWLRFYTVFGGKTIIDWRPNGTEGAYPLMWIDLAAKLSFHTNGSFQITGTTIIAGNTWYHVAVSRASGQTRMFLNGVQEGITYADSNNYGVGPSRPMLLNGWDGTYAISGWIDEFRVSKGIARWTSNFTPPAAPY